MYLITSNKNKLAEFQRFGMPMEAVDGKDLKEVDGSPLEVIIHKAIDAGENLMVEDTVLEINGEVIVDIRWKLDELNHKESSPAVWKVSLAVNLGDEEIVAIGVVEGVIKLPTEVPENAFGFDPYFYPITNGKLSNCSLAELEQQGKKDEQSARRLAVDNFLKANIGDGYMSIPRQKIMPWTKGYQND